MPLPVFGIARDVGGRGQRQRIQYIGAGYGAERQLVPPGGQKYLHGTVRRPVGQPQRLRVPVEHLHLPRRIFVALGIGHDLALALIHPIQPKTVGAGERIAAVHPQPDLWLPVGRAHRVVAQRKRVAPVRRDIHGIAQAALAVRDQQHVIRALVAAQPLGRRADLRGKGGCAHRQLFPRGGAIAHRRRIGAVAVRRGRCSRCGILCGCGGIRHRIRRRCGDHRHARREERGTKCANGGTDPFLHSSVPPRFGGVGPHGPTRYR